MKKLLLLLLIIPLTACVAKAVDLTRKTPVMLERAQLLKMAEAGDVEAQYALGKNYCCGTGVFYDNAEAVYWWCQAGRSNQPDALFELGNMSMNTHGTIGTEVPVDPAKAYAYYALAEKNYHKEAGDLKRALEPKLTREQRIKADDIIADWPDTECELPVSLKPKPDSPMPKDAKRSNTI